MKKIKKSMRIVIALTLFVVCAFVVNANSKIVKGSETRTYIKSFDYVINNFKEGMKAPSVISVKMITENNEELNGTISIKWTKYQTKADAIDRVNGVLVSQDELLSADYYYNWSAHYAPFDETKYWNDENSVETVNGKVEECLVPTALIKVEKMKITINNFSEGQLQPKQMTISIKPVGEASISKTVNLIGFFELDSYDDIGNGRKMEETDRFQWDKIYIPVVESNAFDMSKYAITSDTKQYINDRLIVSTANAWNLFVEAPTITSIKNTSSGIELTWKAVKHAELYNVYRRTDKTGWELIKTTNKLTFTDTTAKAGVKYTYRLYGMDETTTGYGSTDKTIMRVRTTSITSAKGVENGIKISWNKLSEANKYMVYRKTVGSNWETGWTWIANSYTTTYTDKTVENGKTYVYCLIPYGDNYKGYKSAEYKTVKVTTPSVKGASVSNGIKVNWGKINIATKYQVFRKTVGSNWETGWTWLKDTSSLTFTDTTAKAGTSYVYAVKAIAGTYQSACGYTDKIKK